MRLSGGELFERPVQQHGTPAVLAVNSRPMRILFQKRKVIMRLRGHGWDDRGNLGRGILDAICPCGIVRLLFVFSIGDFGALQELAVINGTPQSKTLQLQAGKKYRFRFIIIATNNQGMQVLLRNTNGPVEWLNIAKDGADLPPGVMRPTKAQLTITVGETYDVEF